MTTIKVKDTVFGNFKWSAQGEFETPVLEHLAMMGLVQILQRVPAGAAEKKIAGYEKRPEKFERSSIEYSEGNADLLRETFEEVKIKIEGKEYALGLQVEVKQHVPGEGPELKYKAEKAKIREKHALGEEAVLKLAETVGYEGEDYSEESLEFAQAIKKYIDGLRAAI